MSSSGVLSSGGVAGGAGKNALATAATVLTSSSVAGDINDRFQVLADGTLQWGPGNAAPDAMLHRVGVGQLSLERPGAAGMGGLGLALIQAPSDVTVTNYPYFSIGYSHPSSPRLEMIARSAGQTPLALIAAAAQTADLFDVLASDGVTALARVKSSGDAVFNGITVGSGASAGPGISANIASFGQVNDGTNFGWSFGLTTSFVKIGPSRIYNSSGAPGAYGADGDFYFRFDTPGTANQRIYVHSAGAWVGIL